MQLNCQCIKYAIIQVFSDMCFPGKEDSVLMGESAAQRKTVFWHISSTTSFLAHLYAIRGKQKNG